LFVLAPQFLQLVTSYTALGAAVALLAVPVGVGAGTGLAAAAIARVGASLPGVAGLIAMAAGFSALAWALPGLPWWQLAVGLVVFGVGFGLAVTPGTVLILEGLPAERRSVASAVNDITREVGGVVGIAVLSAVLSRAYADRLATAGADLPPEAAAVAAEGAAVAVATAPILGDSGPALVAAAQDAFSAGFEAALWIGAATLLAAALLVGVIAPRRAGRAAQQGDAVGSLSLGTPQ